MTAPPFKVEIRSPFSGPVLALQYNVMPRLVCKKSHDAVLRCMAAYRINDGYPLHEDCDTYATTDVFNIQKDEWRNARDGNDSH